MPYTSKLTTKEKREQKETALTLLREWLKPGDTVYTTVKHVARSGMSRTICAYVVEENRIRDISGYVSSALEWSWDDTNYGVRVGGCGMDMGFHLVYSLSRRLFPDGFGIVGHDAMKREVRPPTKEKAIEAIEKGFTFHGRNGDTSGWDDDGGYALRHEWM